MSDFDTVLSGVLCNLRTNTQTEAALKIRTIIVYLFSISIIGMLDIELYGEPLRTRVMLNVALNDGSSKHGKALLA